MDTYFSIKRNELRAPLLLVLRVRVVPTRGGPLHMEAYLPMSSGEWGEAGVGESTFHDDSKDVLASAFGLHGTL